MSTKAFAPLTALDPRPVDALSRAQISVILGLEHVLQQSGLVLLCPRCASNGHGALDTGNSPEDDVWKIDCQCRRRRVNRTDAAQLPSGDLLLLVKDLLGPVSLDVRCPSRRCINHPLEMRQTVEGLIVTCRCGGKLHFRKLKQPTVN